MARFTRRALIGRAGAAALAVSAAPIVAACQSGPLKGARTGGGARAATAIPAPAFATPPGAPDRTGVTVSPDDPRIDVTRPDVRADDGTSLMAYMAGPRGITSAPGVLLAHGVRGPTEHVRDVVRRLATAGFLALTIDLAARDGGIAALPEPSAYRAALFARSSAARQDDYRAAHDVLRQRTANVAALGWGFGGNNVWKMLLSDFDLRAAVAFDGPLPANYTELWRTRSAVFAGYAELNARVTRTAPDVEEQLKRAGVPYRITVYPGVDRGFDNDSPESEHYDAVEARRAWMDTVTWLRTYLLA